MKNSERKNLRHFKIELRAKDVEPSDDGETPQGILEGYASVYDAEYRVGYFTNEIIAPGAFGESLKRQGGVIPIFYEHDWNDPIGFANAEEDEKGLRVEALLFIEDSSRARTVYRAVAAGALREWSIGFLPETIELSTNDETEMDVETVTRGDLVEASVVVRGANPETEMIDVRSAPDLDEQDDEWISDVLDRSWLRDELRGSF